MRMLPQLADPPLGLERYTRLAARREGDRVVCDGTFAASNQDHLAAGGVAEAAPTTRPRFVMVFEDVTRRE